MAPSDCRRATSRAVAPIIPDGHGPDPDGSRCHLHYRQDQPSLGIITPQIKRAVVAEYGRRNTAKPIGTSQYRLDRGLAGGPQAFAALPSKNRTWKGSEPEADSDLAEIVFILTAMAADQTQPHDYPRLNRNAHLRSMSELPTAAEPAASGLRWTRTQVYLGHLGRVLNKDAVALGEPEPNVTKAISESADKMRAICYGA